MPYKDSEKQRAYSKLHYLTNKKKYIQSNKKRRDELKDYIRQMKQTTPCTDCGINYPYYVMDFDHIKDKEALINKFITNNNRTGLKNELAKCEVVCSNCHRQRSYASSMQSEDVRL